MHDLVIGLNKAKEGTMYCLKRISKGHDITDWGQVINDFGSSTLQIGFEWVLVTKIDNKYLRKRDDQYSNKG